MYVMPEKEKVALKRINSLDSWRAVEFMKYMGKKELVCQVCGFLKSCVFVIPNETRWQCQACGKCCTPANGPTWLPADIPKKEDGSCSHCVDGKCNIENNKPPVCKRWPFNYLMDSKAHPEPIIIISTLCTGFGKGKIITDDIYSKLQSILVVYGQVKEAFE